MFVHELLLPEQSQRVPQEHQLEPPPVEELTGTEKLNCKVTSDPKFQGTEDTDSVLLDVFLATNLMFLGCIVISWKDPDPDTEISLNVPPPSTLIPYAIKHRRYSQLGDYLNRTPP